MAALSGMNGGYTNGDRHSASAPVGLKVIIVGGGCDNKATMLRSVRPITLRPKAQSSGHCTNISAALRTIEIR